jgi:hypothetical protein
MVRSARLIGIRFDRVAEASGENFAHRSLHLGKAPMSDDPRQCSQTRDPTTMNNLSGCGGNRGSPSGAASPVLRIFEGLARAWSLSPEEEMLILDIGTAVELARVKQAETEAVPTAVVERVAVLVDIFRTINVLLPVRARADAWIRRSNQGRLFGGRQPLDLITESLAGMNSVRQYLLAEVYST